MLLLDIMSAVVSSSGAVHTPTQSTITPAVLANTYYYGSWVDDAISGLGAGLSATLLFHPLELIKTRLQVQHNYSNPIHNVTSNPNQLLCDTMKYSRNHTIPIYKNSINVVTSIFKYEGIGAFYKGLTPNLIGNVSAWGLYFMLYNHMKSFITYYRYNNNINTQLKSIDHLAAASLTGCTIQLITNPIWLIKTRMFLDTTPQYQPTSTTLNGTKIHANYQYRSFIDSLRYIVSNEGIRGLYKGMLPGLLGVSHGAVQFMAYEQCKLYVDRIHRNNRNTHIHQNSVFTLYYTPFETMCMAAASKTFAAIITYPYQVIRSRLQDSRSIYTSASHCVIQTYKQEGIRGFYRGLTVNVVKVTPQAITVFVVYESIQSYLKQHALKKQYNQQLQL